MFFFVQVLAARRGGDCWVLDNESYEGTRQECCARITQGRRQQQEWMRQDKQEKIKKIDFEKKRE